MLDSWVRVLLILASVISVIISSLVLGRFIVYVTTSSSEERRGNILSPLNLLTVLLFTVLFYGSLFTIIPAVTFREKHYYSETTYLHEIKQSDISILKDMGKTIADVRYGDTVKRVTVVEEYTSEGVSDTRSELAVNVKRRNSKAIPWVLKGITRDFTTETKVVKLIITNPVMED